MPSRWISALFVVLVFSFTSVAAAQPDPRTYPTADLSAVHLKGTFSLDWPDGAGGDLSWGGGALGVTENGVYLFWSCVRDDSGIAKLLIPPLGARAQVVQPCAGPRRAEIAKVHPDPAAYRPVAGGVLQQLGRLCVTGYITYDVSKQTARSHWCGSSLRQLSGPFAGTVNPGFVGGAMAPIPPEWRTLLGGPALTSLYDKSIISRSSYGFTASVFDPWQANQTPIPMTMLVGCPDAIASCRTFGFPTSNDYNGSELTGGFFIVPETRTLVAIEREASGPSCYGYATRNPALHGTPYLNEVYCYSLSDPLNVRGPKGYPYRLVAKLYDLNDLVLVKQGRKQPWDIRQYATIDLPGSSAAEFVTSGVYNPVRDEFYLVRTVGGGVNTVHVYGGFARTAPPRAEVCGDRIDNDRDGYVDEGCTSP